MVTLKIRKVLIPLVYVSFLYRACFTHTIRILKHCSDQFKVY